MSTPRLRRFAALGVAGLVMASCAQEEGAAPASTVLATTTTTTTTVAPTTTPAPTTTTTTTTSTTTAPPTTAAPVPTGDPTDASTPIFAGNDQDAWLYLGRWTGSTWERAFDDGGSPIVADITAGTAVRIGELGQTSVAGEAGELADACTDESAGAILGPIISPNAGVPDVPGFGYRAVAAPAEWALHPREAVQIDDTIQAYADAGVAAFSGTGVETQAGEVDQTVVVDLDGDGDTEVLVVFGHEAERVEGDTTPPGGFSALLLIDADSRDAIEIAKSFTPVAAEGEEIVQPFDSYRVLDVADLNGDGISEVVIHSWFVDGASVGVYSYDGSSLTEVLLAGCGS